MLGFGVLAVAVGAGLYYSVIVLWEITVAAGRLLAGLFRGTRAAYAAAHPIAERRWHARRATRARR